MDTLATIYFEVYMFIWFVWSVFMSVVYAPLYLARFVYSVIARDLVYLARECSAAARPVQLIRRPIVILRVLYTGRVTASPDDLVCHRHGPFHRRPTREAAFVAYALPPVNCI